MLICHVATARHLDMELEACIVFKDLSSTC